MIWEILGFTEITILKQKKVCHHLTVFQKNRPRSFEIIINSLLISTGSNLTRHCQVVV